eukprot:scaffold50658_cov63-Phaeocystis_antarctica.AAC.6
MLAPLEEEEAEPALREPGTVPPPPRLTRPRAAPHRSRGHMPGCFAPRPGPLRPATAGAPRSSRP